MNTRVVDHLVSSQRFYEYDRRDSRFVREHVGFCGFAKLSLRLQLPIMDEDQAGDIFHCLRHTLLKVVRVQPGAPSTSTFTALKSSLQFRTMALAEVKFTDVFGVDIDTLTKTNCNSDVEEAVDRLCSVMSNGLEESLATGLSKEPHKGGQLWYTVAHVLFPLTNSCILSMDCRKRQTTPIAKVLPEIQRGFIGIGTEGVWHGTPDAICNIPVLTTSVSRDTDSSDGATSTLEEKVKFVDDDLKQVVGHAVVASFINKNRHPHHNSMTPSVGLAKGELIMAAYDCTSDVLLILHPPVEWFSLATQSYDAVGLVTLWAFLHHRLFVKRKTCVSFPALFASSLKQQFRHNQVLERFEKLSEYGPGQEHRQ